MVYLSQISSQQNCSLIHDQSTVNTTLDKKIISFIKQLLREIPNAKTCAKKIGIGVAALVIVNWHINEPLIKLIQEHMGYKFIDLKNPGFRFILGQKRNLFDWDELAILTPLNEELGYRCYIQYFLFKKMPQSILQKFGCKKLDAVLDWRIATAARIILTSYIFATHHVEDNEKNYIASRFPYPFLGGLLLGTLYESQGYLASAAAHLTQNIHAVAIFFWYVNNAQRFPVKTLPWWFYRSLSFVSCSQNF